MFDGITKTPIPMGRGVIATISDELLLDPKWHEVDNTPHPQGSDWRDYIPKDERDLWMSKHLTVRRITAEHALLCAVTNNELTARIVDFNIAYRNLVPWSEVGKPTKSSS